MFTQFCNENIARLLHQRVAVAAAFDDTWLQAAGAVADATLGNALQKFLTFLPQRDERREKGTHLTLRIRNEMRFLISYTSPNSVVPPQNRNGA